MAYGAAWRVFWTTRMAVLLVAVFAALSFGPATGGLGAENAAKPQPLTSLPRFVAVLFPIFAQFASWHWVS
jgi:hypothetical protein